MLSNLYYTNEIGVSHIMNYDGSDTPSLYNQSIISQFTKQAVPYSKKHNSQTKMNCGR
jgi:hypothetical protein